MPPALTRSLLHLQSEQVGCKSFVGQPLGGRAGGAAASLHVTLVLIWQMVRQSLSTTCAAGDRNKQGRSDDACAASMQLALNSNNTS